jgi:hypothetical protein
LKYYLFPKAIETEKLKINEVDRVYTKHIKIIERHYNKLRESYLGVLEQVRHKMSMDDIDNITQP